MFKAYGPISRELFGLEPINLFPQKSDGRGVHTDIPPVAGTGAPATDCPLVCEDTDSTSGTENLQSPLEKSKKKRTLVAEILSPRSEIYKIFINNYSRGEAFFEALEEFKMKESNIMLDRSFNIIDDEEARKRILEIREEYAIKRQRIDIMFPEKVVYDLPNDDPSSASPPVQLSTNNKGSNYSDNGSDSDQST